MDSQKGSKGLDKIRDIVDRALKPIRFFQSVIELVVDALSVVPAVYSFVEMITRAAFCAFQEAKDHFYDVAQRLIQLLSSKISTSMSMINDLYSPLSILNTFKAQIKQFFFDPLKELNGLLVPIFDFLHGLEFLKTIATYEITIPIPYPTFWPPFYDFYDLSFSLEDVARTINVSTLFFALTTILNHTHNISIYTKPSH